jgi:S-DNA-T family DNA segregation ATPase FtsK/SpoIIIE
MGSQNIRQPQQQYASFWPEILLVMIVGLVGLLVRQYIHSVAEIVLGIGVIGLLIFEFRKRIVKILRWNRWRHRLFPAFHRLGGRVAEYPPRLTRVQTMPHGVKLYVTLSGGVTVEELALGAAKLASSLKVRGRVIVSSGAKANRAIIEVQDGDPFGDPQKFDPPTMASVRQRTDSTNLPIGQDASGSGVYLPLRAGGVLVGGVPGSGKSNFAHLVIAYFACLDGALIYLVDPKNVELNGWRHRATRFGVSEDEAIDILDEVISVMVQRYQTLGERGERSSASDMVPILVVLEEVAVLLNGHGSKDLEQRIGKLLAMGRAAGITIVLVAQRPAVDTIPAALRDLADIRMAFRTTTPDMSDVILGRGSAASGFDASKITEALPGLGYLSTGAREPFLVRCYFADDETLEELQRDPASGEGDEES